MWRTASCRGILSASTAARWRRGGTATGGWPASQHSTSAGSSEPTRATFDSEAELLLPARFHDSVLLRHLALLPLAGELPGPGHFPEEVSTVPRALHRLDKDFTVVTVLEKMEEGLEVLECLLPGYFKVFSSIFIYISNVVISGCGKTSDFT